jgi:dihydrofolate synthase/folylpolyglutamate synthase
VGTPVSLVKDHGLNLLRYAEIIKEIENQGIFPKKIPSLDPMHEALKFSGLIQKLPRERTIVVAGTNGKGSTCAYLESLIRKSGCHTLLYTSPHLVETTERIRLDGNPISQAQFVESFERILPIRERLKLSHFDTLTLMAADCFVHYSDPASAWLILEVGLGGKWDSTNAFPHDQAVLTRIGLDHQDFLGHTLEEIAENKLGIIPGTRTVTAVMNQAPEVIELFHRYEKSLLPAAHWRWVNKSEFKTVRALPPKTSLLIDGKSVALSLSGRRSAENAQTALMAFENIFGRPASEGECIALSETNWPGRLSFRKVQDISVLYSGDHNLQGIESLCEILPAVEAPGLFVLFGASQDKPALEMLERILNRPEVSKVFLTSPPFKGKKMEAYGAFHHPKIVGRVDQPREAFSQALELLKKRKEPGEVLLVTGSLYLVGALISV